MIVDAEDTGRLRLPSATLEALLEAARDEESVRTAGRAAGEAMARDAAARGEQEWDDLAATWTRSGLGTLGRERPHPGIWLLRLEAAPGASGAGSSFWESLLAALLAGLAGEPLDVASLPPGVGADLRLVAGAPAAIATLRRGFAAGWTLERMLEGT